MKSSWLYLLGHLLICLIVPIVWGWAVDRLFHWFESRRSSSAQSVAETDQAATVPSDYWDYQI